MTASAAAFRDCPCGSGTPYSACCGLLHDGADASTAEALMRARYSAYAVGELDYVFRTWHPRTRPDRVSPAPGLTWTGLRVVRSVDGGPSDDTGEVEFVARFRSPQGAQELHETSSFERRGGRWVYVSGEVT